MTKEQTTFDIQKILRKNAEKLHETTIREIVEYILKNAKK
jgi:hypothetical protein